MPPTPPSGKAVVAVFLAMPHTSDRLKVRAQSWASALLLLVSAGTLAQTPDQITQQVRFRVPMSCAALEELRAADYPDAVRVYDEGQAPRSFEEAERAVLGLQWRQRQHFAEDLATRAFAERFGRPPTAEELGEERRRWIRTLRDYPAALREAVETNCEVLFEAGEERRRAGGGGQ